MADDTVKVGLPSDEAAMMVLLREMHAENGLAPLDEDKVRAVLRRGLGIMDTDDPARLALGPRAIVGVIRGKGGVIEASAGLFVGSWWYSGDEQVEDLWNFVSEPYRRSEHAKKLLTFAKQASKGLRRPLLMGVLTSTRTEAKVRLYERQLGRAVGAIFVVPVVAEVTA